MDLYGGRGYEQTTVAEIAKRAGLTERTFFRHFSDKREVLFAGSHELEQAMVAAVEEAPADASPLAAAMAALERIAEFFAERRPHSRRRQAIINANPELQERERNKLASLSVSLAYALRERGVSESRAILAAEMAIAIFKLAFERWLEDAKQRDMLYHVRSALKDLKSVALS